MEAANTKAPADLIEPIKATANLILQKKPRVAWLELLLSTVDPEHPVFAKDYMAPRRQSLANAFEVKIPNPDGFFDGLPQHMTAKRGKRRISLLSKEQASKMKRAKAKYQIAVMQARYENLAGASSESDDDAQSAVQLGVTSSLNPQMQSSADLEESKDVPGFL